MLLFSTPYFICGHRNFPKDGVLPGIVKSFFTRKTAEVGGGGSSRVRREKARGSGVRSSDGGQWCRMSPKPVTGLLLPGS